ncbi:hypothetical protein RHMOL_Rhmol10G0276100 [Rhododendron molle]|uniref:Uncharacterized protein n=1 Tax=Rhododendron molle TaxID=49168 RepID=A0ACC0M6V9_RHOML|nr:hypothetical protein RHMOL_Rhmol10G0276100 [Rhododendron molle]
MHTIPSQRESNFANYTHAWLKVDVANGRVWAIRSNLYDKSFKLWEGRNDTYSDRVASFNTSFLVNLDQMSGYATRGEGLAFVVAPGLHHPLNSFGGYLGLTNFTTDGNVLNQIITIELDTFEEYFDPDSNHVGLNINSVISKNTTSLTTLGFELVPPDGTQNFFNVWVQYGGIKKQRSERVQSMLRLPREYQYRDLQKATNNFDKTLKLGQGWSHYPQKGKLLLVYDYMPNGSLDKHLFGDANSTPLSRDHHRKIITAVASALHYLQNEYQKRVVHHDIKANNIMFDAEFIAKLGDFGLARALDYEKTSCIEPEGVVGTIGYMAPEYLQTCKATEQSDVYAFGAAALRVTIGAHLGGRHQSRHYH